MLHPKLNFERVSVAIHIIEEAKNSLLTVQDNSFDTFEKDLFSFKYEQSPPYSSANLTFKEVYISFSNNIIFNSEGKQTVVQSNQDALKKAYLYLNFTHFLDSSRNIWEIVLHPHPDFSWNEYDIIQLVKIFTGKHESSESNILFSENGVDFLSIFNILHVITNFKIKEETNLIIQCGSLQVDTAYIKILNEDFLLNDFWDPIYNALYFSQFNDPANSLLFEKLYKSSINIYYKYILNVFCGFVLGIFDFDRMEYEEVSDTLIPRKPTTNSFIIANKNNICLFCHNDDLFEEIIERSVIGISPYILLPNSVLAYNDYWASKGAEKIIELNKKDKSSILEKQALKNNLVNINETYFLPNVFQYPTERLLYQIGTEYRGTYEKIIELRNYTTILTHEIDSYYNIQNRFYSIFSLLIGIISITQIYTFIKEIKKEKDFTSLQELGIVFLLLLIIMLTASLINRRILKRHKMD